MSLGNICIIGHNYFDNTFFSNLNKLSLDDIIVMEDLNENKYEYIIYDIYEIDETEIWEVQESTKGTNTLTLCTCTLNKTVRLIIKAKLK